MTTAVFTHVLPGPQRMHQERLESEVETESEEVFDSNQQPDMDTEDGTEEAETTAQEDSDDEAASEAEGDINNEDERAVTKSEVSGEDEEEDEGEEEEEEEEAEEQSSEEDDDEEEGEEHEADEEAEEDNETERAEEDEVIQVVNPKKGLRRSRAVIESPAVDDESASAASSDSAEDEDEDEDSNAEAQWEEESNAVEEVEEEALDPSRCIFCGEDEEQDPSEEYEEYMACAVCGDNAHRQCARNAHSLKTEEDAEAWRCPGCIENNIEPEKPSSTSPISGVRRASAPKIVRDLLPAVRGTLKPGSHSIFSELILDDHESTDGPRPLRKRKASNESDEKSRTDLKRHKRGVSSSSVQNTALATASAIEVASPDPLPAKPPPEASTQKTRPSRTRRPLIKEKQLATLIHATKNSLVICFYLPPAKLSDMKIEQKKRRKRERERERRQRMMETPREISHYPPIQSSFATPFYAFHDRDGEGTKSKPYGGILSAPEADTSNTFPLPSDRKRFEDARLKAEEEWRLKVAATQSMENIRPAQKGASAASKIKCISFGNYEIDTWHAAPYPEEYSRNRVLYICEFCLKYMNSDFVAWRHKLKCPARHPPGDEIYRDGPLSFFEVDGRKNPVYCQNLCLLAKLFLGSKTLYYDVEPFLFYIMTENDEFGCHFVGYFSKEKRPSSQNNVSCILVLPIHQRRGFGHLLIEFSYLLTRVEKKTGSPEKPLSDMGLVSYRSYWRLVLCYQLINQRGLLSITDLSDRTGMTADDIICALEALRAVVRDPVTRTYALRLDYAFFRQYIENYERKGYVKLNPDALIWVPYIMGRNNMHYEDGPQLHTVRRRSLSPETPEEGIQLAANGVSEKDYAEGNQTSDFETQASGFATPHEDMYHQLSGTPTTPLPLGNESNPSTPRNEGFEDDNSFIPPTRFEVFPPLPGMSARRRAGRPFGRGANRRGTPVRRNLIYGDSSLLGSNLPATTRKTRSRLGEVVLNGISSDDAKAQEQDEFNGEAHGENQDEMEIEAFAAEEGDEEN